MSDLGFLIPVCLHEIWALGCVSLHQICAMLEDGAQSSVCATQSLYYRSGISLSSHQKHTSATLRSERLYPPALILFSDVVLVI